MLNMFESVQLRSNSTEQGRRPDDIQLPKIRRDQKENPDVIFTKHFLCLKFHPPTKFVVEI